MRSLFVLLLVLAATPALAQPAATPLGTVDALFDAMRAADAEALRALFHPEARLQTVVQQGDSVRVAHTPLDAFAEAIADAAPGVLDERLLDGVTVEVDGALASVWTPYAFYADGAFSHCGANAFHLVQTDAGWQILTIIDTRQREGCELENGE